MIAVPGIGPLPTATVAIVLAQQPGQGDHGGQGEDFGKSSPVGLLVLLLFLIAVAFLVRSMSKHLKRVPASFDNDGQAPDTRDPGGARDGESDASGHPQDGERGAAGGAEKSPSG
jgi:hypothetical protein